jgi:S-adenosylmethionine decarboxylase
MLMTQVMADAYGCNKGIEDCEALISKGKMAVAAVGATVVGETSLHYVPHGLTIGLFLAESHLILTTWPEFSLLCIDTLLCNPDMDADRVIDILAESFCPDGRVVRHRIRRNIAQAPNFDPV